MTLLSKFYLELGCTVFLCLYLSVVEQVLSVVGELFVGVECNLSEKHTFNNILFVVHQLDDHEGFIDVDVVWLSYYFGF